MGGRGADFLKNINKSLVNLNEAGRVEVFENDMPVDDNDCTEIEKELKQYNLIVYKSMHKLPADILQEQLEAINNRCKKSKKLMILTKNTPMEIRLGRFSKPTTQACFTFTSDFNKLRIVFNSTYCKYTTKYIKEMVEHNQDIGWWAKSDKNNLLKQTATHEFGHFIQFNMIKKMIDRRHKTEYNDLINKYVKNPTDENKKVLNKLYEDLAWRINNKIALISKKKYDTMDIDISEYGQRNSAEWFAEVYTNMSLSTKPTDMAKAMKSYLKENSK